MFEHCSENFSPEFNLISPTTIQIDRQDEGFLEAENSYR